MKIINCKNIKKRKSVCEIIMNELPDFYKENKNIEAYQKLVEDTAIQVYIVEDNKPIGIAIVSQVKPNAFEIEAIGVLNAYKRKKIGSAIFERIFKDHPNSFIIVKALDDCKSQKEFHQIAKKFYEKMGFIPLLGLPEIWGKKNPCMLMVKSTF